MQLEYAIVKHDVLNGDQALVNELTQMSAEGWEPQSFHTHAIEIDNPRWTIGDAGRMPQRIPAILMIVTLAKPVPISAPTGPRGIAMKS